MNEKNETVIDGEGEILGRIASFAAKKALQGDSVVVINCNNILISGNRQNILENYLTLRKRPNVKFPSMVEQIMKRTVRGMINYKSGRGAEAFGRIRCYNKIPEKYQKSEKLKLGNKNKNWMKLKELSEMLKMGR